MPSVPIDCEAPRCGFAGEGALATDAILSRELKSLQEEIASSKRETPSSTASTGTAAPADRPADAGEEREAREQLREFVDELSKLVEEGEKNIAAHPIASMAGALVVGILIGRLLGRR